ncbi:MAG: 3-dehydroquinate synthase [Cyanobacteria bacterium SIG30]|nr:3-dehydroquinate synthase [Cyanobacteria bacterium SIG30]
MKNLTVNLKDRSYEIIIEKGILKDVKSFIDSKKRVFVISNKTVFDLYGKYFDGYKVLLMGDGEKYKNFETYKTLCEKLLSLGIQRTDLIVAFGGGVVGDMAGFVASTCLRGIDLIQIPTTLLAQVDSSVGGKTGIDTDFGKNLIGTFYQPRKVIIDPEVLSTLPERQIKTGLAEVLKYAFIEKNCNVDESELFFDLLNNPFFEENYDEIIYRCCKMKASVVEQDEKEGGLRAILNFGHTIAHAIEKITNYEIYTHGEAVAIGMKSILKLALLTNNIDKEYYEYGISFLEKLNLNIELDKKYDKDEIVKALQNDKKVKYGKLNFVMPKSIGFVELIQNIDELLIKESLP